jgi:hypothetical protein
VKQRDGAIGAAEKPTADWTLEDAKAWIHDVIKSGTVKGALYPLEKGEARKLEAACPDILAATKISQDKFMKQDRPPTKPSSLGFNRKNKRSLTTIKRPTFNTSGFTVVLADYVYLHGAFKRLIDFEITGAKAKKAAFLENKRVRVAESGAKIIESYSKKLEVNREEGRSEVKGNEE